MIFLGVIFFPGCIHLGEKDYPFDFGLYEDGPMPPSVAQWLKGGVQSAVTPRIAAEAEKISGRNRRERLLRGMEHVWKSFSYDSWFNTGRFLRTADELYERRVLGGCSDYALVEIALFRALGIPSRMVMTASVDWIYQYRQDDLTMTQGHSFIEVFLEQRWHLVDTTFRWLFSDYDPCVSSYPHGEYLCMRGKDFWDMGIMGPDDLDKVMSALALDYAGDFTEPLYPKDPI